MVKPRMREEKKGSEEFRELVPRRGRMDGQMDEQMDGWMNR